MCRSRKSIPSYQLVTPGGDTGRRRQLRIPHSDLRTGDSGRVPDAGIDRLVLSKQLKLNPDRVANLNGQFPEAAFPNRAVIAAGTQKIRMSTGLELQVMMPVVNAPFRVYWAYNPMRVDGICAAADRGGPELLPQCRVVLSTRSRQVGQAYRSFEQASMFRFTIGRTF